MKIPVPIAEPEFIGYMSVFKVQATNVKDRQYYYGKMPGAHVFFCSCPGFNFRQTCKHVDTLKSQRAPL